jgi:hypothetical protein
MRYLILFENYKKAEHLINRHKQDLSTEDLDFIDYIKSNVDSGYIGKLVEFYIDEVFAQNYDAVENIKWVIENIKNIKLSNSIDSYTLPKLINEIKKIKNLRALNKLKKINSIKYDNMDLEKIAINLVNLNVDLSDLEKKQEYVFKPKSDKEFIEMITDFLFKNEIKKHKDWDVLYEDDKLLIYEILSYEGGIYLAHNNQCIKTKHMYDYLKKSGVRPFNIIDKQDINNSIFIDKNRNNEYNVHKWNDAHIGMIINNKPDTNLKEREYYITSKVDFFINNIIDKIV